MPVKFAVRAAARLLDLALYYVLGRAFVDLLLRLSADPPWPRNVLLYVLPLLLMLLLEPVLLCLSGRTVGKALLGLKLQTENGDRPGYGRALRRTFLVAYDGLGFWLPLFNILRVVAFRRLLLEGEPAAWDDGLVLQRSKRRGLGYLRYAVAVLSLLLAGLFVQAERQRPLHRGPLTAPQYVANVNDLVRRLSVGYDAVMQADGSWLEEEEDRSAAEWLPLPDHQLLVVDGVVRGVTIHAETDSGQALAGYVDQKALAYVSLVWAERRGPGFFLQTDPLLQRLQNAWSSFEEESQGFLVRQRVDFSGYETDGLYLLPQEEAGEHHFALDFSLSPVP